jgi:Baseplate J-like protein
MSTIPVVMTAAGPQPTAPFDINQRLLSDVASLVPDYTATLPGSLIEDISSTDTAAIYQIDQARIDAINSITPYGANLFILSQMAEMTGIPQQGQPNRTSVYVVFTGTVGFAINPGYTVRDGLYNYTTQDGVIIPTGGVSVPVFCLAELDGPWVVLPNTVTTVATSVPGGISLSVNNPTAGIPGGGSESDAEFRARAMQAYMVTGQGMISYLKSNLLMISGVQPRLVAIKQSSSNYMILCGGGDPYEIAYAIFRSMFWLPGIVGSATTGRNITVSVYDYPNLYPIVFVNPPLQTVAMTVTWIAISPTYVDPAAVAQLAAPALIGYINEISVGQPINLLEADAIFQAAVESVIPIELLGNLTYVVIINGTTTAPTTGTKLIPSDPESYFFATSSGVTVVAG